MKTIQLQISPAKARQLHRTASVEIKTILEESAPAGFFSKIDPKEFVNSYESACEYWGIEPMNEAEMLRAGFRQDEIDRRKCETIAFVFNGGEYLDMKNTNQCKYLPWFDLTGRSGFAFCATCCCNARALAGDASRLCFKNESDARHAGQQPKIVELYKNIVDNKPNE